MFDHEIVEHVYQIISGDGTCNVHRQALPSEDVLDVEQFQLLAVSRLIKLEVHCPDGIGFDWAHRPDVHTESAQRLLAFSIGNLQALYAPQALDALLVHPVPFAAAVLIGPLPAEARMVLGELNEPASEFLFVVGRQGDLKTLGRAVLADHPTGSALFHPERLFEHGDCSTTGVRG